MPNFLCYYFAAPSDFSVSQSPPPTVPNTFEFSPVTTASRECITISATADSESEGDETLSVTIFNLQNVPNLDEDPNFAIVTITGSGGPSCKQII